MARMVEVQVRRWQGSGANRKFDWQTITVEEGLRLRDETFRCPTCLGMSARRLLRRHGYSYSPVRPEIRAGLMGGADWR
jgi:hypothetical protein